MLLSIEVSEQRCEAVKMEMFIKRQKSRLFILLIPLNNILLSSLFYQS